MLRNQDKNTDNRHYRMHTETKVEMGRTYSKNTGQWVNQTLHTVLTKEREEKKRRTMQKMARRHNKGRGNHLEPKGNRQRTMEDIDGGLHPAVDGQSQGEK